MNLEHLNIAIAVMQRVANERRPFDMEDWQESRGEARTFWIATTEKELCTCGTAACFAGWLAVSPEFQAEGGYIGLGGIPIWTNSRGDVSCGEDAIAEYLGIPEGLAEELCGVDDATERAVPQYSEYYGCALKDVTAQMVLDKLIALREEHS